MVLYYSFMITHTSLNLNSFFTASQFVFTTKFTNIRCYFLHPTNPLTRVQSLPIAWYFTVCKENGIETNKNISLKTQNIVFWLMRQEEKHDSIFYLTKFREKTHDVTMSQKKNVRKKAAHANISPSLSSVWANWR